MGKQDIIGRILSDAEAEASAMLEEAASRAESIRKNAEDAAAREREKAQKECEKKRLALLEGRRAAARLDAQKIALQALQARRGRLARARFLPSRTLCGEGG